MTPSIRTARRHGARVLWVASMLFVLACAPVETTTKHQPGPGTVAITGDPVVAPKDLAIRFASGGEVGVVRATIAAGEAIALEVINLPGTYALVLNDAQCEGAIVVRSEQRTQVVLRIADRGCDVHEPGSGSENGPAPA